MKKKVLFVGSFQSQSKSGGVGGQMFACMSLINSKLSNNVDWLLVDTTAESNLIIPIRKRIFNALLRQLKFVYLLVTNKVELVIVFSSNGLSFLEKGMMILLAKFLKPRIKTIFAPRSGRILNEVNSGKKQKFAQRVFRKSDIVICQGQSWKEFFQMNVIDTSNKYLVIKNWINIDNYSFQVSKSLKVEMLFLAWLEKDKGLFDLIQAVFEVVKQGHQNFILRIAGKGKHEEQAKDLVDELGLSNYVNFEGWVIGEAKIQLLELSHIFILPSYFEGSPNALIEAMASGNACISTTVGAIPDIVENYKNGLLIDPGDISSLTSAIIKLLSSEEERLDYATAARKTVLKEHSISNSISEFERIILAK